MGRDAFGDAAEILLRLRKYFISPSFGLAVGSLTFIPSLERYVDESRGYGSPCSDAGQQYLCLDPQPRHPIVTTEWTNAATLSKRRSYLPIVFMTCTRNINHLISSALLFHRFSQREKQEPCLEEENPGENRHQNSPCLPSCPNKPGGVCSPGREIAAATGKAALQRVGLAPKLRIQV